jgi:Transglutaminase-like superfamily
MIVRKARTFRPFQRVMRLFSISGVRRPLYGGCTPRQVAWAVRLASRYVPGATCLPQALATHILLSRCGHQSCLHVGVASMQKFEAHAWVECDGNVVVGEREKLDRFESILTIVALTH